MGQKDHTKKRERVVQRSQVILGRMRSPDTPERSVFVTTGQLVKDLTRAAWGFAKSRLSFLSDTDSLGMG